MTLAELLRKLTDAYSGTPYPKLQLTWDAHLVRWHADITYFSIRDLEDARRHGWTPEEAVRNFAQALKGKSFYRSGQNGNWGSYELKEEVTIDDVAFAKPLPPPPLVEGHNEVFPETALRLAMAAEQVYLKTYIGERPLKGYPEDVMIPEDRGGKGFEILVAQLGQHPDDHPIEIGYYEGGKILGFRGGIL